MGSSLALAYRRSLGALPVKMTPTGMTLEPGLPFEEWEAVGKTLGAIGESWLPFNIGDWINYGEANYGEKYSQALDVTGRSYSYLSDVAWVCGVVMSSCRQEDITYSHHREVARVRPKLSPDEQVKWLTDARENGWSVRELGEMIAQTVGVSVFSPPSDTDVFTGGDWGPQAQIRSYDPTTIPAVSLPDVLDWIEAHPQAAETIARKVSTVKENHQLINASTNNEWYTPAPFLQAAHDLMGGIDLDPASNDFANRVVRAARIYTEDDDGLSQRWAGRLWLNPPYGIEEGESNQAKWSRRLIESHRAGDVTEALLLVNAVTGNQWFAPLKDFPICFPDARIRFYNESTEAGQPTHSNAIVYFGPQVDRFAALFGRFGAVLATREVWDGCR